MTLLVTSEPHDYLLHVYVSRVNTALTRSHPLATNPQRFNSKSCKSLTLFFPPRSCDEARSLSQQLALQQKESRAARAEQILSLTVSHCVCDHIFTTFVRPTAVPESFSRAAFSSSLALLRVQASSQFSLSLFFSLFFFSCHDACHTVELLKYPCYLFSQWSQHNTAPTVRQPIFHQQYFAVEAISCFSKQERSQSSQFTL